MSVQFGRWNYDSAPPAPGYLEKASQMLAPYGPDGGGRYSGPGVDIIYRAFHTTKESRREEQPHAAQSGAVITWDGRLDNREDLIRQLRGGLSGESTDVAIVEAAYEKWGTGSFGKLVGDWALSIWNPRDQALILAKDFVGTRHLYYTIEKDQVTWSSILDPLVLLAGKQFALEEEYIAGWLAFFPATHLTPYVGIQAVPPSAFVRITPCGQTVRKYWDFDPGNRIRYRTDAEYEEHFRSVFAESVKRRLRSDTPVLAELSGGMDSSSIVCMADRILAQGGEETPRLDTVSYYDDREPNWNERPYFTKVEEQRGRAGCHIDVGSREVSFLGGPYERFASTPGDLPSSTQAAVQFASHVFSQGYRIVLSGVGGDEVLGGLPSPVPELADLLVRLRLFSWVDQSANWALHRRKTAWGLFFLSFRSFSPRVWNRGSRAARIPRWLYPNFVRRYRSALEGYERRLRITGPLPSFQENLRSLDVLRGQLSWSPARCNPIYEKRFSYLDRELLEFVFAVPRQQIVRPAQRRSLMRRSLDGIVPTEILSRRRKAYVVRGSLAAFVTQWSNVMAITQNMASDAAGIIDQEALRRTSDLVRQCLESPTVALARSFALEEWLRQVSMAKIIDSRNPAVVNSKAGRATRISAEKRLNQKGGEDRELLQTRIGCGASRGQSNPEWHHEGAGVP